ncbi:MAG: hypothetical protein IPL61_11215 [Myxococcales bacterium]|nr:hypothetical protein [Myxococcales bacterium]
MSRPWLTVAGVALAIAPAAAERPPRLPPTLPVARMPTTLTMRLAPTPPPPAPAPPRPRRRRAAPARREPAPPRVTAQLAIGMAVDGAALRTAGDAPTPGVTVGGAPFTEGVDYRAARAYGFGEAFLGSRGLVVPGISAYLASRFRLAPTIASTPPIVDAWDKIDPLQVRAAWTEADGVIDSGALRTLRIRGGRQYVYGPAVAHLDGLAATWSTSWLRTSVYLGSRVPDWDSGELATAPRQLITGGEVAVTLRQGPRPLAVRVRALRYADASHSDVTVDWTPRPDVALALTSRLAGREVARHHASMRVRVSAETRLVFDADLRRRADWVWDYDLRDDDPGRPRRYLDLGPRLPRTTVRGRAGTVLLDNIDALVFGGLAFDGRGVDPTPSFTSAGWVEGGGALEIRMRRTVALTLTGLARVYSRVDAAPAAVVTDEEDQIQALAWPTRNVGERNLIEGGAQVRFTGGARKFSVSGELYARRTRYAQLYVDDADVSPAPEMTDPLDDTTVHGGGRFVFEAWISPRMRVRSEYELSSRFASAPEIAGLKALRIVAEGRY